MYWLATYDFIISFILAIGSSSLAASDQRLQKVKSFLIKFYCEK
jgi:hypothetical protein